MLQSQKGCAVGAFHRIFTAGRLKANPGPHVRARGMRKAFHLASFEIKLQERCNMQCLSVKSMFLLDPPLKHYILLIPCWRIPYHAGGGRRLSGPHQQIYSYHSKTSCPMMPKLSGLSPLQRHSLHNFRLV